jgi:fatty-acyl-CoA synthase
MQDRASSSKGEPRLARKAWLRALELTAPIGKDPHLTFPIVVQRLAERFADAPALLSAQGNWSHRELGERANRCARWALSRGIGRGDRVCLMLPNCREYLALWLGITRIGGVAALVNAHLTGEALVHAIDAANPRHIIADATLAGAVAAVRARLPATAQIWTVGGGGTHFPCLDPELDRQSADPLSEVECAAPALADLALLIYTSGTTGLPKAARASHFRLMQWSHWFAGMMETGPNDRLYNCLPMYHAIGGVAAIGAALLGGGSVVIRRRFSVSSFWADVTATECTLFQYIGELCRYLVQSPPQPCEAQHQIRLCCGNGLSVDVWERFQSRFRIPRILEFYAASEGVLSLYNPEGKRGSIGRVPPFLAHRFPVTLIKLDLEAGEPQRDADGRCIRCAVGEIGEAIAPGGGGRFEGYTDEDASVRKLLHDVFAPGDTWFRTGDLMRQDASGYFYFVDRIGDTFRWKGENVSTGEVAAVLANCSGVVEAVVYGVRVPGTEGRAGMAAIIAGPKFELGRFRQEVAARLPDYARPLFLRLRSAIETTATYRPLKQGLARDGFDPAASSDPLYFHDRILQSFVPLDAAFYRRIIDQKIKL